MYGIQLPENIYRWFMAITAMATSQTLATTALLFSTLDARALQAHQDCVQDQEALRGMLRAAGLVAFVVEGALLPRCSQDV